MKFKLLLAVLASVLANSGQRACAENSQPFSISVPDFLIPLDGKTSILDVYTDGRAPEVSGYNVLGSQDVLLRANTVSAGSLTLNLHLPGFALGEPGSVVESARLLFSVNDLDFFPDQFATGVYLQESAFFTAINGTRLAEPVDFMDLLPSGVRNTDGRLVTLDPLVLSGPNLPVVDFSQPYVLTFTFNATMTSRGLRAFTIHNAPESIASDIRVSYIPTAVPEPGTMALLGLGTAALLFQVLRRRVV